MVKNPVKCGYRKMVLSMDRSAEGKEIGLAGGASRAHGMTHLQGTVPLLGSETRGYRFSASSLQLSPNLVGAPRFLKRRRPQLPAINCHRLCKARPNNAFTRVAQRTISVARTTRKMTLMLRVGYSVMLRRISPKLITRSIVWFAR